jgi:peroxiredoxin
LDYHALAATVKAGSIMAPEVPSMLKPGDAAPDFEVKDDKGHTVRLSDFKEKKDVLLWFYPKADTPG